MTQMNQSMKQKQTCGCQAGGAVGKGRIGSLGLAAANYYVQDG